MLPPLDISTCSAKVRGIHRESAIRFQALLFVCKILQMSIHGTHNLSAYLANGIFPVRRPITVEISFLFGSIRSRVLLLFYSDHIVLVTLHAVRLSHPELASLIINSINALNPARYSRKIWIRFSVSTIELRRLTSSCILPYSF